MTFKKYQSKLDVMNTSNRLLKCFAKVAEEKQENSGIIKYVQIPS